MMVLPVLWCGDERIARNGGAGGGVFLGRIWWDGMLSSLVPTRVDGEEGIWRVGAGADARYTGVEEDTL